MTQTTLKEIKLTDELTIDVFKPEYAKGITECFRAIYGDDYPNKVYYDPEALTEENIANRIISTVVKTRENKIVGHCSLFSSNPCNYKIYESGSGLVLPEYRNTAKLFTRMVGLNIEMGKELGIEGVYGEPVCNHPYSQKMCHNLKTIITGLEVDLMPAKTYTKDKNVSGRVSTFWGLTTIVPKKFHKVYIPQIYKDYFDNIYKRLEDKRDVSFSFQPLPQKIKSKINTEIFDFADVARMAVYEIGQDFEEAYIKEESKALKKGVVSLQVWLNLGVPWVNNAVNILRGRQYFTGGLLQRWFDTDGILMQKIIGQPCWNDIQIAFEEDKFIFEYVKRDWEMVNKINIR